LLNNVILLLEFRICIHSGFNRVNGDPKDPGRKIYKK
jgi:hypothetical protein